LGQLRDIAPQLDQLGFHIIGISPDQPARIQETIQQLDIRFNLLSDSTMEVSKAFRVAYEADQRTLSALAQHGIDLEAASGENHHLLPVPAVFLVAGNGIIQFEYVNPDYSVRAHPDLILAAASVAGK
jgi:peroxiredoxin